MSKGAVIAAATGAYIHFNSLEVSYNPSAAGS
jgi:hypothetical protein